MLENIFETKIMGSNTIFLDIPEKEFFVHYDSISHKAAEEITNEYFEIKGKNGVPHVKHIHAIPNVHNVEIVIEIESNKKINKY